MRTKWTLYSVLTIALSLAVLAGCSRKAEPTDAQIASNVQNRIYSDAAIQSRQIGVQAASGVVTLSGDVTSDTERAAAANDAASIDGVRTVVNNLQVQQAQAAPPPPPTRQQAARERPARPAKQRNETANKRHHRSTAPPDDSSNDNLQANNAPVPPPQQQEQTPAAAPAPPAPPPPPQKVTIPAGTQLSVRLNDPLDSERNQVGDTFHGALSAPIVVDGETVISGADVVGRVADVKSAGRFAGNSVLTLELTSLSVNGRTYNVQTNQWSRAGKGEGKSTATKVGIGTAAGAVLGGIIGGGRGAAIGAASGAGAGTGVAAAKKGQQIKLGTEAVLNFQTINTLVVTPQAANDRNAGRTPVS